MTPLPPRDAAELALGTLHRCLDSSRVETEGLYLAARRLREAGLNQVADTIAEAAGRCGGSDSDVQDVCDRLWALLDTWPMTVEIRRAA